MSNVIELHKHKPTPVKVVKDSIDELITALEYYSECLGQEDQEDPGLELIKEISIIHIQAALAVKDTIQTRIDHYFGEIDE